MTEFTRMTALVLDPDANRLQNAYHLGRIARAVYVADPLAKLPDLGELFSNITSFACGSVFGIVAGNHSDAVVAFRGTDANREWVEAVAFSQIDWGMGRVHKGFATALDSVWNPIMAGLFDVDAVNKRIWLTGHSLGGSLATLATLRLTHLGFEPHMTVTYGSPRVMDAVAAKTLASPVLRVVNNEDAVPDFPWPNLLDTYVHVGELVFLLASGDVAEPRHSAHLARRIDRANTIGEGILPSGIMHDHLMTSYLKKLKRWE
jgi:hypothetical protein